MAKFWPLDVGPGVAAVAGIASTAVNITSGNQTKVGATHVLVENRDAAGYLYVQSGDAAAVATANSIRIAPNGCVILRKGQGTTHLAVLGSQAAMNVVIHVGVPG